MPEEEATEEELLFMEIPIVVTASRMGQPVTEAPSSVTVITANEIKKYGYRTFVDILRSIKGFYVSYDRNYHYIGVRGFSRPGDINTRILFLVDGHRVNDNIFETAPIGTESIIDVDLIDRVEVTRGPGSSLYGSNAFFGVINVITKDGSDFKGAEVSAEAASYDTFKGRLSYGDTFKNGVEMILSGSYYDSKGQDLYYKEFDDPDTNNGIAKDSDDDQYKNIFAKLLFGDFTLLGTYVTREKGIPTASYETEFNDSRTRTMDERSFLDLKYEHNFERLMDVTVRLYYDEYKYFGDYTWDYSEDEEPYLVVNKDTAVGKWWGTDLMLARELLEKHKLLVGAEYRNNFTQDQKNFDEEVYLDDRRDSRNWAIYMQDEYSISEGLLLNIGVRHDHYETFGGSTNPRLALIYSPLEKTTLKIIYGEAFRAPNVYELYYDDGETQKANPDLGPETIRTYEIILEQYVGNHIRASVGGFYYEAKDLLNLETDPEDDILVYKNVDSVDARGLELELEGKWNALEGRLSYTFQEAENRQTGSILTNSPKHLAKLNLIVPFFGEKLFASPEVQYMSRRKTLGGDYTDDFMVANLTIFSQSIVKGLDVSASIYNLFDDKYADPASEEHSQDTIEQDGRNFRLKFTYKFH